MKNLPTAVLFLLLAGCGWHLRGLGPGGADLPALQIQGKDPRFVQQLHKALTEQGLSIAATESDWTLVVENVEYKRLIGAVNSAGQAQSFLLILTMRVIFSKAARVFPAQTVRASRDLQYDQSAVLGKEAEEKTVRIALLSEAAQQLLYRYRAISQP